MKRMGSERAIRLNQAITVTTFRWDSHWEASVLCHYSFLGVDPRNLSDQYANYWEQNVNHSKINYSYCVANPKRLFRVWTRMLGLTASDIPAAIQPAARPTTGA
jgi:hypothetical protein